MAVGRTSVYAPRVHTLDLRDNMAARTAVALQVGLRSLAIRLIPEGEGHNDKCHEAEGTTIHGGKGRKGKGRKRPDDLFLP
jgi:hypothetical protein